MEKKLFALDDDMLEQVSGGATSANDSGRRGYQWSQCYECLYDFVDPNATSCPICGSEIYHCFEENR